MTSSNSSEITADTEISNGDNTKQSVTDVADNLDDPILSHSVDEILSPNNGIETNQPDESSFIESSIVGSDQEAENTINMEVNIIEPREDIPMENIDAVIEEIDNSHEISVSKNKMTVDEKNRKNHNEESRVEDDDNIVDDKNDNEESQLEVDDNIVDDKIDNEESQVEDDDVDKSNDDKADQNTGNGAIQKSSTEATGLDECITSDSDFGSPLDKINCTACGQDINELTSSSVKSHPDLNVVICKRCFKFFSSGPILQDDDGKDNQCRWCGQGGNIICCDKCNNAFCKNCIKRNLGKKSLKLIEDLEDDVEWNCYVCDSTELAQLKTFCKKALKKVDSRRSKVLDSSQSDQSDSKLSSQHLTEGHYISRDWCDKNIDITNILNEIDNLNSSDLCKTLDNMLLSVKEFTHDLNVLKKSSREKRPKLNPKKQLSLFGNLVRFHLFKKLSNFVELDSVSKDSTMLPLPKISGRSKERTSGRSKERTPDPPKRKSGRSKERTPDPPKRTSGRSKERTPDPPKRKSGRSKERTPDPPKRKSGRSKERTPDPPKVRKPGGTKKSKFGRSKKRKSDQSEERKNSREISQSKSRVRPKRVASQSAKYFSEGSEDEEPEMKMESTRNSKKISSIIKSKLRDSDSSETSDEDLTVSKVPVPSKSKRRGSMSSEEKSVSTQHRKSKGRADSNSAEDLEQLNESDDSNKDKTREDSEEHTTIENPKKDRPNRREQSSSSTVAEGKKATVDLDDDQDSDDDVEMSLPDIETESGDNDSRPNKKSVNKSKADELWDTVLKIKPVSSLDTSGQESSEVPVKPSKGKKRHASSDSKEEKQMSKRIRKETNGGNSSDEDTPFSLVECAADISNSFPDSDEDCNPLVIPSVHLKDDEDNQNSDDSDVAKVSTNLKSDKRIKKYRASKKCITTSSGDSSSDHSDYGTAQNKKVQKVFPKNKQLDQESSHSENESLKNDSPEGSSLAQRVTPMSIVVEDFQTNFDMDTKNSILIKELPRHLKSIVNKRDDKVQGRSKTKSSMNNRSTIDLYNSSSEKSDEEDSVDHLKSCMKKSTRELPNSVVNGRSSRSTKTIQDKSSNKESSIKEVDSNSETDGSEGETCDRQTRRTSVKSDSAKSLLNKSKHSSRKANISDSENKREKSVKNATSGTESRGKSDLRTTRTKHNNGSDVEMKSSSSERQNKKTRKEDSDNDNKPVRSNKQKNGTKKDEQSKKKIDSTNEKDSTKNDSSSRDSENNELQPDSDSEAVVVPKKGKNRREKVTPKIRRVTSSEENNSDDQAEVPSGTKKPKRTSKRHRSQLNENLEESDKSSDDSLSKKKKKKSAKSDSDAELSNESSDSDENEVSDDSDEEDKASEGSDKDSEDSNEKGKKKKGSPKLSKKRRRIRTQSDSGSGSDQGSTSKKKDEEGEDIDANLEDSDSDPQNKGRKHIRKIIKKKRLSKATKSAEMEEKERRKRIEDRQKTYNASLVQKEVGEGTSRCPVTTRMILDKDPESGETLVEVSYSLLKNLKPHQVEAVKFMWDCVFESVAHNKKSKNETKGCILAHCMGLGKTLSVIALVHTVLTHEEKLGVSRCLVICPLNTVLNWKREFEQWVPEEEEIPVSDLTDKYAGKFRVDVLRHWFNTGGVMIMGYDMFRILSTGGGKSIRRKQLKLDLAKFLLDPGPDIIICDEGHMLKNEASTLTKAVHKLATKKRIILTGTPLQNNLIEYHTMVNFVKQNLLGTRKEFSNRFVNPILNGQSSNSTSYDVKLMKKRAHILYKTLDGCVQRKDYIALTKYLPPKLEFVIMVRLSEVQRNLYTRYLEQRQENSNDRGPKSRLFADQQQLYRVWTHPYTLKMHEVREANKRMYDDESDFVDDEEDSYSSSSSSDQKNKSKTDKGKSKKEPWLVSDASDDESKDKEVINLDDSDSEKSNNETVKKTDNSTQPKRGREVVKKWKTRSRRNLDDDSDEVNLDDDAMEVENAVGPTAWWHDLYKEEYQQQLELSGKLTLLMHILRKSADIGDKVLVFSQSLLSLDIIEEFLGIMHRRHATISDVEETTVLDVEANMYRSDTGPNTWLRGSDYERMDGSTSIQIRKEVQTRFNNEKNKRLRLFLISTKAGGIGINLVAANRVIIFDVSWNPSHDMQSLFRSYRFGQTKPVYVYRLAAQGTMEEKIYERQVTKISLSHRVIDEQQIERHFTDADLNAIYNFEPDIWDPELAMKTDDEGNFVKPPLKLPRDRVLADLITDLPHLISNYHEHDSLLENREDEGLTEQEREEAWREFEEEKKTGMSSSHMQMLKDRNTLFRQQELQRSQQAAMFDPYVQISFGNDGQPFTINMLFTPQQLYQVIFTQLITQMPQLAGDMTELHTRVQTYLAYVLEMQRKWRQQQQIIAANQMTRAVSSNALTGATATPSSSSNVPHKPHG